MMLEATGVSLRRAGRRVLEDASIQAQAGEVHAIIGPNGAGKTTLLRILAGLVKPDQGTIRFGGHDTLAVSARDRAKWIGYAPARGNLEYPFTVREATRMGRYAQTGPPNVHLEAEERALRETALEPLAERPVTQLSGGEQQRVVLARVLCQEPQAFLLDEPTANLDLGIAHRIEQVLRARADEGRLVVVVLHDLEKASRIADRATLLSAGRVLATGAPSEVFRQSVLGEAFDAPLDVRWEDGEGARIRVR